MILVYILVQILSFSSAYTILCLTKKKKKKKCVTYVIKYVYILMYRLFIHLIRRIHYKIKRYTIENNDIHSM